MLKVTNLEAIINHQGVSREFAALVGEALKSIERSVNGLGTQLGVDPLGTFPAPRQISAISVTAANGVFDVQITDNGILNAAIPTPITYTAEYSTDLNFTNPPAIQVHMGHTRNKTIFLGSQTLFWRAYSQYFGSRPTLPLVFGGTTPTAVVGGGVAPPAPQKSQGSGTASPSFPGGGYGRRVFR